MTTTDIYGYSYGISSSSSQITLLGSLTTPVTPPKSIFRPFSLQIPLGDGTVRGAGWATAIWHWDVLSRAERDMLRTFCTGQSASVWIQTRTMDTADSYAVYSAVMVWPIVSEERDTGRRMRFDIEFRKLVLC